MWLFCQNVNSQTRIPSFTYEIGRFVSDGRGYRATTGTIWMMVGNRAGWPPGFGFG
jgi:hypothetical protein